MKKSAILYDFLNVRGGAEAVTLDLCQHFPEFDLVAAFVNPNAFSEIPLQESRLHILTSNTELLGWQTIKSCLAFEYRTSFLGQYQTLIFSGSNAPLAVINSQAENNIYYCHTPPRFVYDLKSHYLSSVSSWQKPLLKGLIAYLQPKYEASISKMDKVFANSKNVQARLKQYLHVDSEVLYPPCRIDRFKWRGAGNYFLSTARLEDYKRVELVIRAFMKMPDKTLVVTSGGHQLTRLRKLSAESSNIHFTGWVSESELAELIGNCLATIYIPNDEDFGMSPVESIGAGKPVIGVNEGGVKETVLEGHTGWLLPENPDIDDIVNRVCSINMQEAIKLRTTCEKYAQQFSPTIFYERLKEYC